MQPREVEWRRKGRRSQFSDAKRKIPVPAAQIPMKPDRIPLRSSSKLFVQALYLLFVALLYPLCAGEETIPRFANDEKVSLELEKMAHDEARAAKLEVKRLRILPSIGDATEPFQRSRIEVVVAGDPQLISGWLSALNDLKCFRRITSLRISPNRQDPTKQDCMVEVHQWFAPNGKGVDADGLSAPWTKVVKRTSAGLSPVAAWKEILKCLPKQTPPKLVVVEVKQELGASSPDRESVRILGDGKSLQAIKDFGEALKSSEVLKRYRWDGFQTYKGQGEGGGWSLMATAVSGKHDGR